MPAGTEAHAALRTSTLAYRELCETERVLEIPRSGWITAGVKAHDDEQSRDEKGKRTLALGKGHAYWHMGQSQKIVFGPTSPQVSNGG